MFSENFDLLQFFQFFDTDQACRIYLEQMRWNGSITCIHCEHNKVYKCKDGRTYKCAGCKKKFSVTTGTIFERSHIPLTKWFGAIYLYTSHKSSVSSAQISRHMNISKKSAWFMHQRIMETFKVNLEEREQKPGIWEVDEVYIGPLKNRIKNEKLKRLQRGTGYIHMTPILGFYHRGGDVFGKVIPDNADQKIIQPIVKKYISPLGLLMTDGSGVYMGLNKHFLLHERFIHNKGEYGRGEYHSNSIEGTFRHFKDTIRGSYKQLTRKHLQRYWDEFCFRFNTRDLSDIDRFLLTFNTINRRLTYQQLIRYGGEENKENCKEKSG